MYGEGGSGGRNFFGTQRFCTASHSSPGPQLPELLNALFDLPFRSCRKPASFVAPFDSAEARGGVGAAANEVAGRFNAEVLDGGVVFDAAALLENAEFGEPRALRCFSADVCDPAVAPDRLPIVSDDEGRDVLDPDDELKRF